MSDNTFTFAREEPAVKKPVQAPERLAWSFHARSGLDAPFHGLISHFGGDIIMDLDKVVLDTPIKAAIRATKIFQTYSIQVNRQDETREVMLHLAQGIKVGEDELDDIALLPPEAVFHGFARPRG